MTDRWSLVCPLHPPILGGLLRRPCLGEAAWSPTQADRRKAESAEHRGRAEGIWNLSPTTHRGLVNTADFPFKADGDCALREEPAFRG